MLAVDSTNRVLEVFVYHHAEPTREPLKVMEVVGEPNIGVEVNQFEWTAG